MKIAVTSQNFRTVTPHAGRTRRFLVYRTDPAGEPVEIDRLDMPKDMAMHAFHGEGAHPLDSVDVVIAGSFGTGFARRMAKRGVRAVTTDRTDPLEAVRDFIAHPDQYSGSGGHGRQGHGWASRDHRAPLSQLHDGKGEINESQSRIWRSRRSAHRRAN